MELQEKLMNNSNRLLVVVVVLQLAILAGQWLGSPAVLSVAQAQVPDAGNQRAQMIDELKSIDAKMDKLVNILESAKLQVRPATPDEDRAPAK
jgi:hypothetical protein